MLDTQRLSCSPAVHARRKPGPIEALLGEFLDPAQRRFARSVLVEDHGYPELEPEAVDFEP